MTNNAHTSGLSMDDIRATDQPRGQMNLAGIDPLQEREFTLRKRDGRVEGFNEERIFLAIEAAFKAELGLAKEQQLPPANHAVVRGIADRVVSAPWPSPSRGRGSRSSGSRTSSSWSSCAPGSSPSPAATSSTARSAASPAPCAATATWPGSRRRRSASPRTGARPSCSIPSGSAAS